MKNLRHETLEKIHAIQENQQEFEKKCEPLQGTKIFSRLYLKAESPYVSMKFFDVLIIRTHPENGTVVPGEPFFWTEFLVFIEYFFIYVSHDPNFFTVG